MWNKLTYAFPLIYILNECTSIYTYISLEKLNTKATELDAELYMYIFLYCRTFSTQEINFAREIYP